jgi:hypothetical protein
MVRIAIHPKEHEHALIDQTELTQGLKAVRFERLEFSRSKDHNSAWAAQMFLKFMLGYIYPAYYH